MSDNGEKERDILKVVYQGGEVKVMFGTGNVAYLTHALRVAGLEVDNYIIGLEAKKAAESTIIKPPDSITSRIK